MNFQTRYNRVKTPPEIIPRTSKVEKQGYISAEKRIGAIMAAGMRLDSSRREQFDFPDGQVDESFIDPTRSGNYDMADAFQDGLATQGRLNAQKKAAIDAAEAEKLAIKTAEKMKKDAE